ncbi:MAG: hypothetical protein LUD84_06445 [Clostridiales bacterium]|nr:hypothetical protein [Clostridiales bacterium]
MRTIELKSGNPSYRYGGVLLTQKKPRATVSDALAEAMLALGKVSEVTEATAGTPRRLLPPAIPETRFPLLPLLSLWRRRKIRLRRMKR